MKISATRCLRPAEGWPRVDWGQVLVGMFRKISMSLISICMFLIAPSRRCSLKTSCSLILKVARECSRSPSLGIEFHHGITSSDRMFSRLSTHMVSITAQAALARVPDFNNVSTVFYERIVSPNDDFSSIAKVLGDDDIAIVIPVTCYNIRGKSERRCQDM